MRSNELSRLCTALSVFVLVLWWGVWAWITGL